MKAHEKLLFLMTLILGIFCGVMLYVMVYAPAFNNSNNLTDISQLSFQVTGHAYGRCQTGTMVCPSFQLNADGSYQYMPWYSSETAAPPPVTGTLSVDQLSALKAAVTAADYTKLERPGGTCAAIHGGTDYQYSVVLNGQQQELDTCNTIFGRSTLATTLAPLWNELRTQQTAAPATSTVTPSSWLEQFLHQHLAPRH